MCEQYMSWNILQTSNYLSLATIAFVCFVYLNNGTDTLLWWTKRVNPMTISCHILVQFKNSLKGQKISKWFFSGRGFAQKTNKNMSHTSKNEFIRWFLGESLAWLFLFEINWPLVNTRRSLPSFNPPPNFWAGILWPCLTKSGGML